MSASRQLDPAQLDALREVANIGSGHAATALSEMTHRPVLITVPRVSAMRLADAAREIAPRGGVHAAVALEIVGDLSGRTLLVLDARSARALVDILLGCEDAPRRDRQQSLVFDAAERSALQELGNILTSAYAGALGEFLNLTLLPSVPRLRVGELPDVLAQEDPAGDGDGGSAVICVETRFGFRNAGDDLAGHYILVPEATALMRLLHALRVER